MQNATQLRTVREESGDDDMVFDMELGSAANSPNLQDLPSYQELKEKLTSPPVKRPRTEPTTAKPQMFGGRFTIGNLERLLKEYDTPMKFPAFKHITHVFVSCLEVEDFETKKVRINPRYAGVEPFLKRLRTMYGIQIVASVNPVICKEFDTLGNIYKSQEYWTSLEVLMNTHRFDLLEINLELYPVYDTDLKRLITQFYFRSKTILVLNNQYELLKTLNYAVLRAIVDAVKLIVVNSHGYLQYLRTIGCASNIVPQGHSGDDMYIPVCDTGMKYCLGSIEYLTGSKEDNYQKVLLGIDTCGIKYNMDSCYAASDIELVPNQQIRRWLLFEERPNPQQEGHTYEMKDFKDKYGIVAVRNDDKHVLSFDTNQMREEKLRYVKNSPYYGFVSGELLHDCYGDDNLFKLWNKVNDH